MVLLFKGIYGVCAGGGERVEIRCYQ